jgi:CubicO group peptidase (beta-lactamase class C family)
MRADSLLAQRALAGLHRHMDDVAAELCEPEVLQRLLERYVAAAGCGSVVAAFAAGPDAVTASVNACPDRPAPIGCLAKLLTATLVIGRARRGVLALDAPVAGLLDAPGEALRGVTVRQLLEHTHGFDDSLLAAPRHVCAFIDRGELLSRAGALLRWAPPGAVYSYGNAGAWLLAALLERLHGRTFATLVRDELLAPLCTHGARCDTNGGQWCAALGTGLALTAAELVRFALHAADGDALSAPLTPLPGWHPLERGIALGFKYAGGGWLGHQSVWPGASTFLRVHPQRRLALAVVAHEQPAAVVALGVLGKHFGELFAGRSKVPAEPRAQLLPGRYEQAAHVVAVAEGSSGLSASAWDRDERGMQRGQGSSATLVRAGGVWFARPATGLVPYLEAIPGADGTTWLWNGRVVLRRAGR